jgi:hypothetical protein
VGGAVYIGPHAAARVSKNVFRENERREYGGAVFCNVESEPLILANEFTENSTVGSPQVMTHRGGAIAAVEDSVVTIGGGTFLRNRSYDGAAVYGASGCQIEILGSRFEENVAEDDGGAILSNGFGLRVFSSTFLRNRSKDTGGRRLRARPDIHAAVPPHDRRLRVSRERVR